MAQYTLFWKYQIMSHVHYNTLKNKCQLFIKHPTDKTSGLSQKLLVKLMAELIFCVLRALHKSLYVVTYAVRNITNDF